MKGHLYILAFKTLASGRNSIMSGADPLEEAY